MRNEKEFVKVDPEDVKWEGSFYFDWVEDGEKKSAILEDKEAEKEYKRLFSDLSEEDFNELDIYVKQEIKYMNVETGSIGNYDDWYYTDEEGFQSNAVDEGDVVKVCKDCHNNWVED